MKKLLLLICMISLFAGCQKDDPEDISNTSEAIPDERLRRFCLYHFDTNEDGVLSKEEAAGITDLELGRPATNPDFIIYNLKGIEHFNGLKYLYCSAQPVKEINVSKNTELSFLYCYNTQLQKLDVSRNTKLERLDCGSNMLHTLDVSKNPQLTYLACYDNLLTKLDLSRNPELNDLSCHNNLLTELDISKNTKLRRLYCSENGKLKTIWVWPGFDLEKPSNSIESLHYNPFTTEFRIKE